MNSESQKTGKRLCSYWLYCSVNVNMCVLLKTEKWCWKTGGATGKRTSL